MTPQVRHIICLFWLLCVCVCVCVRIGFLMVGSFALTAGSCTADSSKPCPLGWAQDTNGDCLAPAGYSGRCVGRKSFSGMKNSEKELWAKLCDVTWCAILLRMVVCSVNVCRPALWQALPQNTWRQRRSREDECQKRVRQ